MKKVPLPVRMTLLAAMQHLQRRLHCSDYEIARYLDVPRATVCLWLRDYILDDRQVDPDALERLLSAARAHRARDRMLRECDELRRRDADMQRDTVLSECLWLVRGNPGAQFAVRRYMLAMADKPPSWWTDRAGRSLSWWLSEIQSFASDRMAA